MENMSSMEACQKVKIRTITWTTISTSGYISKKTKTLIWRDTCMPVFIAALLSIAKLKK